MHFISSCNEELTNKYLFIDIYPYRKTQRQVNNFSILPHNELKGYSHGDLDGWMPERYTVWTSCLALLSKPIANQLLPVFLELDVHISQDPRIAHTHTHTCIYMHARTHASTHAHTHMYEQVLLRQGMNIQKTKYTNWDTPPEVCVCVNCTGLRSCCTSTGLQCHSNHCMWPTLLFYPHMFTLTIESKCTYTPLLPYTT